MIEAKEGGRGATLLRFVHIGRVFVVLFGPDPVGLIENVGAHVVHALSNGTVQPRVIVAITSWRVSITSEEVSASLSR